MRPHFVRIVVAASLLPLLVLTAPWRAAATVLAQDLCPEPNDSVQQACYLSAGAAGEIVSFLSVPEDVDVYRFESRAFNVQARVELGGETPAPYVVRLVNWSGETLAGAAERDGAVGLSATLGPPGSYFLVVSSPTGAFDPGRPYRLRHRLEYPSPPPGVLFSTDFRARESAPYLGSGDLFEATHGDGEYAVRLKVGSETGGSNGWLIDLGPRLDDFWLSVDARIVGGAAELNRGGFLLGFRVSRADERRSDGYFLEVGGLGLVRLSKRSGDELTRLAEAVAEPLPFGVSRTVVMCAGDVIRVNLNGRDVLEASDASLRAGRVAVGALTWGEPVEVRFDNVLVTRPL